MNVGIVIIDSRSKVHGDWVNRAVQSARSQTHECDVVVVDNTDNKKTIGQCWNAAVKNLETDWILFLGDDDFISRDLIETFLNWIEIASKDNIDPVCMTSYMTAFNETTQIPVQKPHTGMWKREFLLENPFNEKLNKQVDRQYLEEAKKKNIVVYLIPHYMGYFYRQHEEDRCAGTIHIGRPVKDLYIISKFPKEIDKIFGKLGREYYIESKAFNPELAKNAKAIWCDWGDENAVRVSNWDTDIPRILVLRAYEAYLHWPFYIKFENFDKVIFIAEHIKNHVERKIKRKLNNAIVINNGADLDIFNIPPDKPKNNSVAYAGWISRKKGAGELLLAAKHFPEYDFHIAGKFAEEDIQAYFMDNMLDNVYMHPWQYDLNEWFKDKTFFINTSLREGCPVTLLEAMAAGLKPLVYNWTGSKEMFGETWVWNNFSELGALLNGVVEPERYRNYIENLFNLDNVVGQISGILEWQQAQSA